MRKLLEKITGRKVYSNTTKLPMPKGNNKVAFSRSHIQSLFYDAYNGHSNPFSTTITYYGRLRNCNLVYELSEGESFLRQNDGKVYGVTFLTLTGEKVAGISKAFYSGKERSEYLDTLVKEYAGQSYQLV